MLYKVNTSAQCIQFGYDAAGDRISRNVCPEALIMDIAEKKETRELQTIIQSNHDDIIIYPNPTTVGYIRIQSPVGDVFENIIVTDILGRVLVNKRDFSGSLNISHLQVGRYFVRMQQGDRYKVVAILKQ